MIGHLCTGHAVMSGGWAHIGHKAQGQPALSGRGAPTHAQTHAHALSLSRARLASTHAPCVARLPAAVPYPGLPEPPNSPETPPPSPPHARTLQLVGVSAVLTSRTPRRAPVHVVYDTTLLIMNAVSLEVRAPHAVHVMDHDHSSD